MSLSPTQRDELNALLGRYCDGTATAADHADLAEMLDDNPDARAYYLRYMSLHAELQWNASSGIDANDAIPTDIQSRALTGGAGQSSGSAPALSFFGNSRIAALTRLAAAIAILLGFGAAMLTWTGGGNAPDSETFTQAPHAVKPNLATVVDVANAEWADPAAADFLQVGTTLEGGTLHLRKGRAQIVLGRGSVVTMIGNTKMEVIGDNACRLDRGKMRVYVPEWASGFTVQTPSATVTDLGTEFGVEVDARDRTEVHVFQGLVEVGGADGDVSTAQRMTEGQARKFGPMTPTGGQVVAIKPGRFGHRGDDVRAKLPTGVAQVHGSIHPTDAPPSLARHRFEHNGRIALIAERRGVVLKQLINVSYPRRPGMWSGKDFGSFAVPAGKKVDVYLLHFDPVGILDKKKAMNLAGTIRFERPILGVIATDAHLEASDEQLGLTDIIYDATPAADRGMDGGLEDSVTLSSDRKELFIQSRANHALDQVRILVAAP